jgi:glycosyltransferase involved in cell wall biosynthesis
MKLYLDNIKLCDQAAGGVSTYWCELIDRLLKSNIDLHFIENQRLALRNVSRNKINIPDPIIINQSFLPQKIMRYLPVFNVDATAIFHTSYYRKPYDSSVKTVVTVYDFVYERYRVGLPRAIHTMQKNAAILRADAIICISESTKNDLLQYCPSALNKNVSVIGLAASDTFFSLPPDALAHDSLNKLPSKEYVLYVGDRSGYKNFDVAVQAMALLSDLELVIVGGGELKPQELETLNLKLANRYHHLGTVSESTLNILYNNAHCLLYPSSYEGFGIPLLEAMQAGCIVVASNSSSIPEVCGDSALLSDTLTADSFAEKIILLNDASLAQMYRERGIERAKLFSWDKMYHETINVYQTLG